MTHKIVHLALVVNDYDEAIAWYTGMLGFELLEDTPIPAEDKRWVLVAPPGGQGPALVLAQARNDTQRIAVGNQSGGRVFLFMATDDVQRDYRTFSERGVRFVQPPVDHPYATVAIFEDLYGNQWDLLQHVPDHPFAFGNRLA